MITRDRILELTAQNKSYVFNVYKHLHQYPELTFHEFETCKYIRKELKKLDIPFREGYAKTGILGVLRCKNPKKRIIALRADMDALPINEEVDIPYKSKTEGVMHACGHDAHVASLLGVIKVLHSLKEELEGTFLFIFQPAEERFPGGAKLMLDENIFDGFEPDVILAQHVLPSEQIGRVGFRSGIITASVDEIHIDVIGVGGHAALLKNHNAVLAAASILLKLQDIPDKYAPHKNETVLAFGRFIADGIMNVIPKSVRMDGTLRTFDEKWRKEAHTLIKKIAAEEAEKYGCTCDVQIDYGYPGVLNDSRLTLCAESYARELIGEEQVFKMEKRMTGEDFGYFSLSYPALFFRVGTQSENVKSGDLHTSMFRLDPDALDMTTSMLAWLAVRFMEETDINQKNHSGEE
jgi:amidohydrolase